MRARFFALLLLTCSIWGCSEPTATPKGADAEINDLALSELADFYLAYSVSQKGPPKSVEALELEQIGYPLAYQSIVDKSIIVAAWGAALPDLSIQPGVVKSDQVLAYQSKVPTEGGLVLLLDRRIVQMTPDEFKAAPKAAASP